MKRPAALVLLATSIACGSGPQATGDTSDDDPPTLLEVTEVVKDDCGFGDVAFDGPYQRWQRPGGFALAWSTTVGRGAPPQPQFLCDLDGTSFSCWPRPQQQQPDLGALPPNTVVELRGELHGDHMSGEATYRVTCEGLDPTCVVEDTGRTVEAPCESVFAFEGDVPELKRPGRCPDEEVASTSEPAEVYVYNYTGKTWYGRIGRPEGPAPAAIQSEIGPTILWDSYQGGFLAFTGTSMSDEDCTGAVAIDAPRVFIELRGHP